MRTVRLGSTGVEVSALCLGCYGFGDPTRGKEPWTLPADDARPLIAAALEAGITFFDTANAYSDGHSEEILGRAIRDVADRDQVVIATKVWAPVRPGPNGAGLSRKAILAEVDASLRRLGTDYIDLYQIHRADPSTPIEETMRALHDVVRAGKVRYLGASSMPVWKLEQHQHVARTNGWTPFVTMQNHYNLLYREEEREMLPYCRDTGVGVIPWSPLARGLLARPWGATSARSAGDPYVSSLYDTADRSIVDAVGEIADAHGVSRAQVALAWVLAQPGITAPIVGVTRPGHLDDALAALELRLSAAELGKLAAAYRPRAVGNG